MERVCTYATEKAKTNVGIVFEIKRTPCKKRQAESDHDFNTELAQIKHP